MRDGWINWNCFRTWVFLWFAMGLAPQGLASSNNWVAFVSDGGTAWTNFDLFALNLNIGITTRLTTNAAIDNHPDISSDGKWVVWSSTRGNEEFDLYLGDFTNVEATARRLTDDSYTNGPQSKYPDRHPHFHSINPSIVLFSSKNQPLVSPVEIISECSQPKIIVPPRFYERMNVITLSPTGTVTTYKELDVRNAWNQPSDPGIWVTSTATYVGHPSFSHAGTQIVFSASIDGDGKVWEVYTVGFNTNLLDLVSNSLRRVTSGPVLGSNPIQMSGGAHFSGDDSKILFSSTRTPNGNSLIFSVQSGATNFPVTSATQLTSHAANDYVPEPLPDGSFIVTSDLGAPGMCGEGEGATYDLDLVLIDPSGVRSNLTGNNVINDMSLIADEVSWFCGLPPNLKDCTFYPRTFSVESLWLEQSALSYLKGSSASTPIPANLLSGFGYPNQAIRMYAVGWKNMQTFMSQANSSLWAEILICLQALDASGFPGLGNESVLRTWMQSTESTRTTKHVIPSIMYERGVGAEWTPWVTTWENPTGGGFGAPANWDLGLPGSNDIARFDGVVLGGSTVVTVNITNETKLQTIEIELVQLSLTGVGTNPPPLNVTSNLNIGGSTGVTSVVVSNIDLTADKIILTTNGGIRAVNSFFDIWTEISLDGGSTFVVGTGAVVRAPNVKIGITDTEGNTDDVVRVEGGTLIVTNAAGTGTLELANGTLSLSNGQVWADSVFVGENGDLNGDGVIKSPVVRCKGSLSPGKSPGVLTIQGNLVLSNTAVVNIELAGTNVGTEYDRLAISGNAYLAGALHATLISNYMPSISNSFEVMTYTSASNAFDTLDLPVLNADRKWIVSYGSTSLVMAVTNIPDGDFDGMDDDWEVANFTNTTFRNGAGDADGDGMSDYAEYVAMTQATNAASVLRIASVDFLGGVARLSFASVVRVPYALEYRDSLTAEPSWAEETNDFGSGGNVVFTNQPPNGVTNRFYRVKVRR